jgi:hypothetical protein
MREGSFKVVRMSKVSAIDLPLIRELFLKALEHGAINPEASIDWYRHHLADPQVGVFVGLSGGLPSVLVAVILPYNTKTNRPLLDLLAGDGDPEHTREVLGAAMDFVRRAGYDKFWCFNFSKHSDEAYMRAMRRMVGKAGRIRSTMMEMDL